MKKLLFSVLVLVQLISADCLDPEVLPQTQESIGETLRCFQDEINTLKSSSASVSVNVIEGLPKPTIEKTTTLGDYKYDLHECSRKASNVSCKLSITNMGQDSMNGLYNGEVYDEFGKKFAISASFISGEKGNMLRELISKVPTSAHIDVNNFPISSTQFTAIKLSTNGGKVVFKGIVIK